MRDTVSKIIKKITGHSAVEGTPARVEKAISELFAGYNTQVHPVTYPAGMNQLIVLSNIKFLSFCEHHCLPIVGFVSVGYVSNGDVLGISKIARIVDMYAQRFQLQERMTREIADHLQSIECVLGVGVYAKATHFCMTQRGVKKDGAEMITRFFTGEMLTDEALKSEFLSTVLSNL